MDHFYHASMFGIPPVVCKSICLLICSMMTSIPAMAQGGAGTTSFSFVNIIPGARQAALGGAAVAINGDVNSLYWNPAGLARLGGQNATVSYANYFQDVQSGLLGYARRLKGKQVVGLGLQYLSFGTFRQTSSADPFGKQGRTFGASSVLLSLSYSRPVNNRLAIGLSVKALHERIQDFSSSALALDVGTLVAIPAYRLTAALVVQQAGFAVGTFVGGGSAPLPISIRVGLTHALMHLPLVLSADFVKTRAVDPSAHLGGEFDIREILFLRVGYATSGADLRLESSDGPLTGFSGGMGLRSGAYSLDYSFTPAPRIGDVHRVTLTCRY